MDIAQKAAEMAVKESISIVKSTASKTLADTMKMLEKIILAEKLSYIYDVTYDAWLNSSDVVIASKDVDDATKRDILNQLDLLKGTVVKEFYIRYIVTDELKDVTRMLTQDMLESVIPWNIKAVEYNLASLFSNGSGNVEELKRLMMALLMDLVDQMTDRNPFNLMDTVRNNIEANSLFADLDRALEDAAAKIKTKFLSVGATGTEQI